MKDEDGVLTNYAHVSLHTIQQYDLLWNGNISVYGV